MISQNNPFPGMNPWLEPYWSDVHTRLIGYIADALSPELPQDLLARAEERIAVTTEEEEKEGTMRPDVAVVEPWKHGLPPVWTPEGEGNVVVVADPLLVESPLETERWVEIRNLTGRVITVIEVLSPVNKRADGWRDYRGKVQDCVDAGVNVVEIDLLRGGIHAVHVASDSLPESPGTHYTVCVSRSVRRGRHEVYLCPLREPLPGIRIPLRRTDRDVPLALQPLIDRCYKMGRHWHSMGRKQLQPPLPDEEAVWADEMLKQAGLAG